MDGVPINYCLEVGFTQNAWIVECGGDYKDDSHCGTFLEIHRPGTVLFTCSINTLQFHGIPTLAVDKMLCPRV